MHEVKNDAKQRHIADSLEGKWKLKMVWMDTFILSNESVWEAAQA